MKKGSLFFVVSLVILLLASCGGSQFRNGSVSINLDDDLLEKAFPVNQKNYRAGDDSKEEYTATVEITGGVEFSDSKTFTRSDAGNNKVFFLIGDLTPGILININLSLKYNDDILYEGGTKDFEVNEGNNPVNLKLKATGKFNKFTHAKVSYETAHGTVPSEFTVKKGYALTETDLPMLEVKGFIFEGWYVGATRYEVGSVVNDSITLVGKWQETSVPEDPVVDPVPENPVEPEPEEPIVDPAPVTYKVTFTYDSAETEKTFESGYELTADDFPAEETIAKEGYTFVGWYDADDNEVSVGYEVTADVTVTAKYEEIVVEEPVEPEPEPEEPVDEGVSFTIEMKVNGVTVADGGDILIGDITNATLAIDYANPEDSALNIRGTAKMKVGEDELESSTLYMPMQLNLPSMLNGRTLDAGTYTIEIYLFNDEIAAEDPLTFTFNVKNEVSVESGIVADIPDFEVVVTYYQDNDYYGVSVQAVAEDECLDVGYDYLWIINGTTFGNASNGLIIFPDGLVSSYGYVPLDFTEANQNVVTCMITNPVTGQSETRSEDFGIKRIGAGSESVSGNQETIVMQ